MMQKPLLKVESLSYCSKQKKIVSDINLSIAAGEIRGLLGPNGAGKTTTFHLICGLIKSKTGQIFLDGHEISKMSLAQRAQNGLGYMAQERSLFPELTVEDNIYCALELSKSSRSDYKTYCDQLLNQLQLQRLKKTPAQSLSGGEARRTELARILALKPKLLLMDEPFAGVDPIAVSEIRDLILQLSKMGITVFITDHNAREILLLCDKISVIVNGTVLATGTKNEIAAHSQVNEFYLNDQFHDLSS
mgnify:CR=1 FL=1|tara:strand:+ start:4197 stop:4937 length:741 start_codon:yes stop_codon:yes gene_type:complete